MPTSIQLRLVALLASVAIAASLLAAAGGPARSEQSSSEHWRVAAASIAAGNRHTCVVTTTGDVRCWGYGEAGRLGYGNTDSIGNDETPDTAGDVVLGGKAVAIAAGEAHTCALLSTGAVRCWGDGSIGQLGYGNTDDIGDDETPASAGNVAVGGKAVAISAGAFHTCAVLRSGNLRCWGAGADGRLGYGNTDDIGDDETPASAGNVPVGGTVTAVSAGGLHTCAQLTSRAIRCWGAGGQGRLGYGNTDDIGDDETPASAGNVTVGGKVVAVTAGGVHTCALLRGARTRCWGMALQGRLGYGNPHYIGDDETPASAGNVDLAGDAVALSAGGSHTCAVLVTGYTRCFGAGLYGRLGYGNTDNIGDDETPAEIGNVPMLEKAVAITTGSAFTCAITVGGHVRCWGYGEVGRLGYGNTDDIGDDEVAHVAGRLTLGTTLRTRSVTSLTLNTRPRRDRSAPYVYRVSGRLKGTFVADRATCTGKVRIKLTKPSGAKVAGATARVRAKNCSYRVRVKVAGPKVSSGNRVRLRVRARFAGNPDLAGSERKASVFAR